MSTLSFENPNKLHHLSKDLSPSNVVANNIDSDDFHNFIRGYSCREKCKLLVVEGCQMFIGSDSIRLYTGFHELNNFIVSIKPIQAFELKLSDIEFDCTVVIWES